MYVFRMILTTNSDKFTPQHSPQQVLPEVLREAWTESLYITQIYFSQHHPAKPHAGPNQGPACCAHVCYGNGPRQGKLYKTRNKFTNFVMY
jgi:hypothetical protein